MAEFFKNIFDLIAGFFVQLFLAFSDIGLGDIIDIIVVAYVIYKAIGFIKETRAKILIKGLGLLLFAWVIAQWFNLITIKWLLVKFFDYAIIAVAIIFQPELRHALERVGHSSFGWLGSAHNTAEYDDLKKSIDDTCKACGSMQEQKIGALIVFERSTPLGEVISTGTELDAAISQELVGNIFFPKSPLHDGGLVIRGTRAAAAGCILPLTSNNQLSHELGTRHRAAVGMSESSDSVVVVVSEETGKISICINGVIERDFTPITLREKLYQELLEEKEAPNAVSVFKVIKSKLFAKKNKADETLEEGGDGK